MFALAGLLMRGNNKLIDIPEGAYAIADHMLEVRNKVEDDGGITTIKKRKYVRKD
jgi:hypothetical protein